MTVYDFCNKIPVMPCLPAKLIDDMPVPIDYGQEGFLRLYDMVSIAYFLCTCTFSIKNDWCIITCDDACIMIAKTCINL